jgi:ATP-binding cassette subfamily B protein
MADQEKKKWLNTVVLKRIFVFVQPYKGKLFLSIGLAIFLSFTTPLRPFLIQLTVDKATGLDVEAPWYVKPFFIGADWKNIIEFIFYITVFQMAFILLETVLRFIFSFTTAALGQRVVKDMRVAVFKKILHLNLRQFDKTPIGTLTTRTINDIESVNDIFTDGFIAIFADLLSMAAVLTTMFLTNWYLTLIALIPFPIMLIATWYFKESVNKSFIQVRNAVASLNSFVQEHITGMPVVQAFTAEEREFSRFKAINRQHRDANITSIFAYSVFFPIVEIVLAVSLGLLVWRISFPSANVVQENLAGTLVAFTLYLNQIFRPLRIIADKFNVLQMGLIAGERVCQVLDNQDVMEDKGTYRPTEIKGHIRFDSVWMHYQPGIDILKNITFSAPAGKMIALVGHTGSGKTSVTSVLNRLYPIQKGTITIDEIPIEQYNLENLRSHIAIVLQDVFLFSGSVLDNITLHDESISLEKVQEAARLIGVHDFIMLLPGGYDFNVMERGNTLSLGQRQLISFIRAILYNPSILIMDEATSSVDNESEKLIQQAIDKLVANRTSIVIAHRLSTIRKADTIIVLDDGEIKEMGNHETLLAKNGFYAGLYRQQFETKPVLI